MKQHFDFGPSKAKQWRGCPGSVAFVNAGKASGDIPQDNDTEFSKEGTIAHDWCDKVLKGDATVEEIPEDMRVHLTGYIQFAESLKDKPNSVVFTEQEIPLFYAPEGVGTLDFAVVNSNSVDILDLKYGAGVAVEAEENDQLTIYAVSLMRKLAPEFNFTNDTIVRCHIYQPRHRDFDGEPKTWETTWRDLQDYAIDILADYQRAANASPDQRRASDAACRFCDARRICDTRVKGIFEEVPVEIVPMGDGPRLDLLVVDDHTRLAVFKHHKAIAKWMDDIIEDTERLLLEGGQIEGLKLVKGRGGNRTWADEDAVHTLIGRVLKLDERTTRKLLSPAQVEKALKAKGEPLDAQSKKFQTRWSQLVTKPEGKMVLALDEDPRPKLEVTLFEGEPTLDDCI